MTSQTTDGDPASPEPGSTDTTGLEDVRAELRAFVTERDWHRYHDPKNLTMALLGEAGELAQELRWVASDAADDACRDPNLHGRLRKEIGDVGLCLVMLADRLGIELVPAMLDKLALNRRKYPAEAWRGRAHIGTPSTETPPTET